MNTNRFIMRLTILLFLIFLQTNSIVSQTSLDEIDLDNGKFKVGFQHYTSYDSTRTYSRVFDYTNEKIERPILVSIWYPTEQNVDDAEPLTVLDYLEILKEEEE